MAGQSGNIHPGCFDHILIALDGVLAPEKLPGVAVGVARVSAAP
jgi:hypothetical protein